MNQGERHWVERGDRRPLYVKVVTEPPLAGCWSVNISKSGIGLIASPPNAAEGPVEGQEIDLEFLLPGARSRIRARGEVRWRHDVPGLLEGATTAIGVSFTRFEEGDQVRLARYLLDYQVNVAVAYAGTHDVAVIRRSLEGDVQLRFGESPTDIENILARGDVSALVICGEDEFQALALVELLSAVSDDNLNWERRPRDLASPVVFCATAAPEHVLSLFNAGKIYRALSPPIEAEALSAAVLAACRIHGMRTEQQRMALELERNLVRERAHRTPPPAPEAGVNAGWGSPAMRQVIELVRLVAPHRVAVLLQGETGTGKEVLARSIHRLSARSAAPFVVQDCGALTETLLESELFGHAKGAFTGAVSDHPGLFVLADGGTIFLDEVENTTANLQAKLLRVIETGEVRPVGSSHVRQVDVRVVAAGNRDLAEEVRHGRFRSDLFYRLNTFTIDVPPLRERVEDIEPLALHFISVFNHSLGRSARGLTPEALEVLTRAEWPGNVRELRNVVERAVLLCAPGEPVAPLHLPRALVARATGRPSPAHRGSLRQRMDEVEAALIRSAFERCEGVLRRAAADLGMDAVTLGRRARRLGLWPRELSSQKRR